MPTGALKMFQQICQPRSQFNSQNSVCKISSLPRRGRRQVANECVHLSLRKCIRAKLTPTTKTNIKNATSVFGVELWQAKRDSARNKINFDVVTVSLQGIRPSHRESSACCPPSTSPDSAAPPPSSPTAGCQRTPGICQRRCRCVIGNLKL